MTRQRQNTVRVAESDRARIPFAMIGVLTLLTSVTVVGVIESRGSAEANADVSNAIDRTVSASQTEVRDSVKEAAKAAAREPITDPEATADTPVGEALREGPDDEIFERYVKLRIYLEASRQLSNAGQRVGSETRTVARLPPVEYTKDSVTDAIDRVELTKGFDSDSDGLENGTVKVTIEGLTVEAYRGGELVGTETDEITVSASTTAFVLHERTSAYETKLDRNAVGEPGFARKFAARMYPIAWAKAGYERYKSTNPTPSAAGGGTFHSMIENREIEVLSNDAIFALQRETFGTQDPGATEAMAPAWSCMVGKTVGKMGTNSQQAWANNFCRATQFLFTDRDVVPNGINELTSGGFNAASQGGPDGTVNESMNPADRTEEVHIKRFSWPAKKDVRNQPVDWTDYRNNVVREDWEGDEYDDQENPPNADMVGGGSDMPSTLDPQDGIARNAIDEVYTGSAETSVDTVSGGSQPDADEPVSGRGWSVWSTTMDATDQDVTVERFRRRSGEGSNPREFTLYDVSVTVEKTWENETIWIRGCTEAERREARNETSATCPKYETTTETKEVSYDLSFTIEGTRSTGATEADAIGMRSEFTSGGAPDPYSGSDPSNFEEIPREALKDLVDVDPDASESLASQLEDEIDADRIDSGEDLKSQVIDRESTTVDVSPADRAELRQWLIDDLENNAYVMVNDRTGSVNVTLVDMASSDDPFGELRNRLDANRSEIVYQHVTGGAEATTSHDYANAPDLARAEARALYVRKINDWMDEIESQREQSRSDADDQFSGDMLQGLQDAENFINDASAVELSPMADPGTVETGLSGNVSYRVHGSPTYLSLAPVNRNTVPQVRPPDEGPTSTENTMHAPLASKNQAAVPNPGVPIIPAPGYWYLSVNAWDVKVRGEYARFEVSARSDGPGSTKPVTYVRESKPVYLEINGIDRRAGRVTPINFENSIPLFIAMPGGTVMPKGSLGTGDRFESGNPKHQLEECSQTWKYVGPGFTPGKRTPEQTTASLSPTENKYPCTNQQLKYSSGGQALNVLTSRSSSSSATATVSDILEDRAEDELEEELYGPMCVREEDEDDDSYSLRGAPGGGEFAGGPANVPSGGGPPIAADSGVDECTDANMTVRFIDMGKGASILLNAPNGDTMLIDAGHSERPLEYEDMKASIEESLQKGADGEYEIDHFVLSHDHRDHNKYIEDLVDDDEVDVENWHRSPVPEEDGLSSNADVVDDWNVVTRGDEISFGGPTVSANVKHPMSRSSDDRICSTDDDAKDCNSVVLRVHHKGHSFLFTGDLKSRDIAEVIDRGHVRFNGTDVVKLPHHGTDSSYNEQMIESIRYAAVISNNDDRSPPSGSPGDQVLEELDDNSVTTYWTAVHDDVVFKIDEAGRLGVVQESEDGDDLDDEEPPVPDYLQTHLPGYSESDDVEPPRRITPRSAGPNGPVPVGA